MTRLKLIYAALALLLVLPAAYAQNNGDDSSKTKSSDVSATSPAKAPAKAKPAAARPAPAPVPKPAPKKGGGSSVDVPRVEWFLGYTYTRVRPCCSTHSFNANGASSSIAYNFNRYFGMVFDGGGVHTGNLGGNSGVPGTFYNYLFGPRFSFRNHERFTPYVEGLIGGAYVSVKGGSTSPSALAGTVAGGLDANINHRFAIRLAEVGYFLTRFRNIPGTDFNQHNLRISSGIVFRFGSINPPPPPPPPNRPPVASCSAERSSVYTGSNDIVAVHAAASDPDNDPLTYAWTASGGRVDGTGSDVRWSSSGLAPGTYTVSVRVDDGRGGNASCSADIRVENRPNRPPVLSCSADRSTVLVGERIHITGQGSDPDGDPLTYSWRTNGGQVVGSGATVDLDTSGVAPGRYTVTGRVDDGRGGAADCNVGVEVQAPPVPPQASKINECLFGKMGIPRVDNACKRILDDVVLRLKNEPRATIVIVGYADPKEPKPDALALKRASNTKDYIVSNGVDGGRIAVRSASGMKGADKENRRVDIIWVPEGATY
jgi:outer membrane protein OmpA-like peptidoglycan-associated protein